MSQDPSGRGILFHGFGETRDRVAKAQIGLILTRFEYRKYNLLASVTCNVLQRSTDTLFGRLFFIFCWQLILRVHFE